MSKNYNIAVLKNDGRETLHDMLGLSSAEISFNTLPAGAQVPFDHSHKENEEIYIILDGKGSLSIDGETEFVEKGNVIRIDPLGMRRLKAADEHDLSYICIQAKAGSLNQFTENDAIISK